MLLLCTFCHERAVRLQDGLKQELAVKYNFPLDEMSSDSVYNNKLSHLQALLTILVLENVPLDKKKKLREDVNQTLK